MIFPKKKFCKSGPQLISRPVTSFKIPLKIPPLVTSIPVHFPQKKYNYCYNKKKSAAVINKYS